MRKKNLDNKGVALVTVVLFFLVLVILLGGVMFSSISNQGNAKLSKDHTSAYYVAESGLNIAMEKLKEFLDGYDKIPIGQFNDYMDALDNYIINTMGSEHGELAGISPRGTYTINTSGNIVDKLYLIRSTGEVNGVSRVIEMQFKFKDLTEDMMKSIYVKGSIIVENPNTNITGSIASLWQTIDGVPPVISLYKACGVDEIYVPAGSTPINQQCTPSVPVYSIPNPGDIEFKDFVLPTPPTTLVSVNVSGGVLSLNNWINDPMSGYEISSLTGGSIKINLGSGNSSRVFRLVLSDSSSLRNSSIEVIGDGKLMIFTTVDASDTTASGNKEKITYTYELYNDIVPDITKDVDLSKIQLILRKGTGYTYDKDPIFTTKKKYYGAILADEFDFLFQNSDIKGFIATLGENITVTANTTIDGPMWIYAPNASVILNSGAYIEGAIIAENVTFESGADLKFEDYDGGVPESVELPLFEFGAPIKVGIEFNFINFKEV